jgi:hypothetical protein
MPICALYETGGLYFDVDFGVRMNLWYVLQPSTKFATVRVHRQSKCFSSLYWRDAASCHYEAIRRLFGDLYQ